MWDLFSFKILMNINIVPFLVVYCHSVLTRLLEHCVLFFYTFLHFSFTASYYSNSRIKNRKNTHCALSLFKTTTTQDSTVCPMMHFTPTSLSHRPRNDSLHSSASSLSHLYSECLTYLHCDSSDSPNMLRSAVLFQWRQQVSCVAGALPPQHSLRFLLPLSLSGVLCVSPRLGTALLQLSRPSTPACSTQQMEEVWAAAVDTWWASEALRWVEGTLFDAECAALPWSEYFRPCGDIAGLQGWARQLLAQRERGGDDSPGAVLPSQCRLLLREVPSPALDFASPAPNAVRRVAVVSAVFFASRQRLDPLPLVKVKLLSSDTGYPLPAEVLVCVASGCRTARPLRALLEVGQMVQLQGWLRVRPHPVDAASDPLNAPRRSVFLEAQAIDLPGAAPPLPAEAASGEEAEEGAARFALLSWRGFRLVAGLRTTAPPGLSLSGFVSLDAAVSLLMAVLRPQCWPRETDASADIPLSVLILDEGTPTAWTTECLATLSREVEPELCAVLRPSQLRRWTRKDYLPLYEVRQRPTHVLGCIEAGRPPVDRDGLYMESIRAGVLSECTPHTLVFSRSELVPAATLPLLQSLCTRSVTDETASFACHPPAAREAIVTNVVHRDGGSCTPFHTPSALLFCLRDGSQLLRNPPLLALTERVDVAVRPTVSEERRVRWAKLPPAAADLLGARGMEWRSIFRRAVAVLRTQRHESPTDPIPAPCAELLQMYFLAAKAVFGDTVETSTMTKLAKLTTIHAQLRYGLQVSAQQPPDGHTRLIDAVVSIALCDSTLHFLSGRTVIGQCVLSLLEQRYTEVIDEDEILQSTCDVDRETQLPHPSETDRLRGSFNLKQLVIELLDHFAQLIEKNT